jgi:hypothetical protein
MKTGLGSEKIFIPNRISYKMTGWKLQSMSLSLLENIPIAAIILNVIFKKCLFS